MLGEGEGGDICFQNAKTGLSWCRVLAFPCTGAWRVQGHQALRGRSVPSPEVVPYKKGKCPFASLSATGHPQVSSDFSLMLRL